MEIGRRRFLGMGMILAAIGPGRRAQADGPAPKAKAGPPESMETWWVLLEKPEPEASRALLKMAEKPGEAVAFLKTHLKRVVLDPDRLNDLVGKLGSDDEAEWRPAFEELEYFDPRVAMPLEDLMKLVTEAPTRQRLVAVLSGREARSMEGKTIQLRKLGGANGGHNFQMVPGGSFWAEEDLTRLNASGWDEKAKWTRAARAISLLEHIGTPDAVAILKDLATGQPSVQPTRVANEALERIEARGK